MKGLSNIVLLGIAALILVIIAVVASQALLSPEGAFSKTGKISVSSNPSGANVFLDNVLKGTTPLTITGVRIGNHSIKLTKSGYRDYLTSVIVKSGQTTVVNATLTPLINQTTTGSISATSNPTGANLYLDGSLRGVTPITVANVTQGSHVALFTKSGYQNYTTTVNVVAGQTTTVTATLTPLNQTANQTNSTG